MKKILIANRGEIALRIMKSAREMGIKTVAVYSEADRHAPHVKYADEAVLLGPPASAESYLRGDKILAACRDLGVDGIHPGYGFLSENGDFAQAVEEAGIRFIGPKASSMKTMGDKLAAKEAVRQYGIPLVPGSDGEVEDRDEAKAICQSIGFPVLIKAAAGGGGKGMRIVERESELDEQLDSAISEAKSAFGNGAVFIEKYVSSPRHIEVQVLCDTHGNRVHLFERECSIQRRHQKVIEEAPSAILSPELREEMGQKAVDVARACDYIGAGTVEFIMDEQHNFYFMEMNTRLQVEHPVTEMITGIDLVKEQIRVARGEELGYSQKDIQWRGHAIETRVYAENARENFMPDIGHLRVYKRPHGTGVRVDDGFEQGMDIPIYYDPMIAKLVTFGATREEARLRMLRAIEEYEIVGLSTTLDFGKFVMEHPTFISGDFDTHFVNKHFSVELLDRPRKENSHVAALIAGHLMSSEKQKTDAGQTLGQAQNSSLWKLRRG